jgi:dihydroorotase
MITFKNIKDVDGRSCEKTIPDAEDRIIDGKGLVLLPGLIDPHVHFRTPGLEHKETWHHAAKAALRGGITTVFDMPNTLPPCITKQRLMEKKQIIDKQLQEVDIPLRYQLYLGADKSHFDEICKCKDQIIGLKVFMGSSTGELVMDDDSSLHAVFCLAKAHDLVLAVHAEDEELIRKRKLLFQHATDPKVHSEIRNDEVAYLATKKAIELAKIYGTRLYILHLGTKRELELVKAAKKEGLSVFAETTPHHLFLNLTDYQRLGTKVQVNPPIRPKKDCDALWQGIQEGLIDTIGSDHAPHTIEEKSQPYGHAPSGMPGVETTLPLLLNACSQGLISLQKIVWLMKTRIEEIFNLPSNDDFILVDLEKTKQVEDKHLQTKCGWSPYAGLNLKGWPVYTVVKGKIYEQE